MTGSSPEQLDNTAVLVIGMIAIMVTSGIGWRKGFFTLPPNDEARPREIALWHVLFVFSMFILLQTTIVPTLYLVVQSWVEEESLALAKFELNFVTQGWINLVGVIATALFLAAFLFTRRSPLIRQVYSRSQEISIKTYFRGSVSWLIAYPWVITIGQGITLIVHWYYHGPHIDQVVVRNIKEMSGQPYLLWATALAVVTVIPFIEETLFRGFLQEWVRQYAGRFTAIAITALIFTFFHYSHSQGIENVELLFSLFTLACFLGFLKEKYLSLWASIGLHSTFNFVSILMLLSGN